MHAMRNNNSSAEVRPCLAAAGFVRGVAKQLVFFRFFAQGATRWRASV